MHLYTGQWVIDCHHHQEKQKKQIAPDGKTATRSDHKIWPTREAHGNTAVLEHFADHSWRDKSLSLSPQALSALQAVYRQRGPIHDLGDGLTCLE